MFKKLLKRWLLWLFVWLSLVMCSWGVTLIFGEKDGNYVFENVEMGISIRVDGESMDIENFIPCVLVKQISVNEEEEALKTQAVIIRTYIIKWLEENGTTMCDAKDLNLEYITYREMEKLYKEEFADNYNKLMKVMNNTQGQVIMYNNEVIKPYFHKSSGGYTRDGSIVLGQGNEYLKSVKSESDVEAEDYLLGIIMTNEQFVNGLREYNELISVSVEEPLLTFQIIDRCSSGYVNLLQVGNVEISGDDFVSIFNLNSPNFQVDEYNGEVRIITRGKGHGFGLSLHGAIKMAEDGYTYKDIIGKYYSGVYLEKIGEE